MNTDDHILETLVAASGPLPAIAAELKMSFIALIKWMDAHADLIATAKRALKSHIKLLSLRAESAALIDLTNVSSTTPNEERKRKSASQLLRHAAKRLLSSPPSPRRSGEKYPSTKGARGMRGAPTAASINESCATNPERELRAPCDPASPADLLNHAASSSPHAESRMPHAVSLATPAASIRAASGSAPAVHLPDPMTDLVVAARAIQSILHKARPSGVSLPRIAGARSA